MTLPQAELLISIYGKNAKVLVKSIKNITLLLLLMWGAIRYFTEVSDAEL